MGGSLCEKISSMFIANDQPTFTMKVYNVYIVLGILAFRLIHI
jgi:hypothetical protein